MEMLKPMHVLLADDRGLVRDAVAAYIQAGTASTVTVCGDLDATIAALRAHPHDVVLVADTLPGLTDGMGLAGLVAAFPAVPVLVLGTQTARDLRAVAREAGARGFLPKATDGAELLAALVAQAGIRALPPAGPRPDPQGIFAALTRRETDVLLGLCDGKTNKEIARELELQEVTVKLHVKTMSRKLGARNRTHAAMIARNAGLI
jgi:DNA-binding NarL/FixJ family response regulator